MHAYFEQSTCVVMIFDGIEAQKEGGFLLLQKIAHNWVARICSKELLKPWREHVFH
jgi:hypothetical protein